MFDVKKLHLLGIALLLFAIACKKSGTKVNEPVGNSLIGKWTYTQYSYSIGGPRIWRQATPSGQSIEFKPEGRFIPCESFLKEATHFEIIDSVTVKIEPASTATGYFLMRYQIDTSGRELDMYPANPICIEGCGYKFERDRSF
jgi:hypothetical protein